MNKKLLIYAINNDIGGGKSVLESILASYDSLDVPFSVEAYVPLRNLIDYQKRFKRLTFHGFGKGWFNSSLIKTVYSLFFSKYFIKKYNFTFILNITDIPIPLLNIKQYFLFDWPYGVLNDNRVWELSPVKERYVRYIKKKIFKLVSKYPSSYLVQTRHFMKLLNEQYGIESMYYFPNSVSTEVLRFNSKKYDYLNDGESLNLLVFTSYYSHKNLEILVDVFKLYRELKNCTRIRFVFTLNICDNRVKKLLLNLKKESCDIVQYTNVGVVGSSDIFSLYNNCAALFLPTVLESFSGTYVEAINYGKPILTSKLPFAYEVLSEEAYYFNPFDKESIVQALKFYIKDVENDTVVTCKDDFFLRRTWMENVINLNKILGDEV